MCGCELESGNIYFNSLRLFHFASPLALANIALRSRTARFVCIADRLPIGICIRSIVAAYRDIHPEINQFGVLGLQFG